MKAILLALFLTFIPVSYPPLPCGGTRCACWVPLQPQFTRHADGTVTSRCIMVWHPQ